MRVDQAGQRIFAENARRHQGFAGLQTQIQAVAFTQNQQAIVGLSQDGEVWLWQASWQGWLKNCLRSAARPSGF